MKKMVKRIVGLALVVVCLLACIPQSYAVQTSAGLPDELFLTQNVSGTCTLSSAAMMLRTAMYLHGNPDWSKVTENSLRPSAWVNGAGLRWNFSHTVGNTTIKVGRYVQSGFTIKQLKAVLDEHPEGVVLYCGLLPHAVFLTGYDGDTFYCADTVKGISERQVTLKESWLGIKYGSQAAVLKKATAYWYITDYMENGQSIKCDCSNAYAGTYIATSSATDLRIRAGHGTSYAILGTIPYGEKVTVLRATGEGSGNWAHISYNGISGYVSMGYLKKVPCEHAFGDWEASSVEGEEIRNCLLCNYSETRKEPNYPMGTVTGSDLCIRAGAGTDYDVKGYLQKGDRVKIIETKQVGSMLWARIRQGWVSMDYIKLDEPAPQTQKGTVNAKDLRIRENAGTSYKVVGYLQPGDRVEIFETKQVGTLLWGRIQQGWIAMMYVDLDKPEATPTPDPEPAPEPEPEPTPTPTPDPEPVPQTQKGTINAKDLRIRENAGTGYKVVGYLQPGDRVEIFETMQVGSLLWGRIQQGWIAMMYVDLDAATLKGIVNNETLNIRAGAGTYYALKGTLVKGDRVEIFETKQIGSLLWGRIEQGWIAMKYVDLDGSALKGTVNNEFLNIRAGTGTNYALVGTLEKGDRVEILETKQVGSLLWGRIEQGWIAMKYVDLD